ncbi:MAG TPA: hypothetical protein QGF58_25015 [Myxococcota bacterium]|nr:hypothetical protein [Myxococcota bacterium]
MLFILFACNGPSTNDTSDSEFGTDPRPDDTSVIPQGSFSLSDGTVVDEDEDGAWSPGEAGEVQVTLTNTGTEGFFHYPGVLLAVDNEDVALETDDWYLMGLEAGESHTATFQALASGTLEYDTTIGFTATVDVINCEGDECPDPAAYSFQAQIEEDLPDDSGT